MRSNSDSITRAIRKIVNDRDGTFSDDGRVIEVSTLHYGCVHGYDQRNKARVLNDILKHLKVTLN